LVTYYDKSEYDKRIRNNNFCIFLLYNNLIYVNEDMSYYNYMLEEFKFFT
jgi:uncharacterized protein YeeX (DUF496 family)